jgi:hypothetical protein
MKPGVRFSSAIKSRRAEILIPSQEEMHGLSISSKIFASVQHGGKLIFPACLSLMNTASKAGMPCARSITQSKLMEGSSFVKTGYAKMRLPGNNGN